MRMCINQKQEKISGFVIVVCNRDYFREDFDRKQIII